MSQERLNKGRALEKRIGRFYRESGALVLLISPVVLRERGCGQIDLAYFTKQAQWTLNLCEIKNGGILSPKQKCRLERSAHFLAEIFEVSVKIHLMKCVAKM